MTETLPTERLFIEFDACEGAIVRIVGLVERRGFRVCRAAMSEQPGGREGSLALLVAPRDPGRCIEVLARQLERLHEVKRVAHESALEEAA